MQWTPPPPLHETNIFYFFTSQFTRRKYTFSWYHHLILSVCCVHYISLKSASSINSNSHIIILANQWQQSIDSHLHHGAELIITACPKPYRLLIGAISPPHWSMPQAILPPHWSMRQAISPPHRSMPPAILPPHRRSWLVSNWIVNLNRKQIAYFKTLPIYIYTYIYIYLNPFQVKSAKKNQSTHTQYEKPTPCSPSGM